MRTSIGKVLATAFVASLTAACGNNDTANAGTGASTASASNSATRGAVDTSESRAVAHESPLSQRTGELLNPDDSAVVMLYYDLAGIAPPIDNWVEEDTRVRFAPAPAKAAKRAAVRAELEAAAAGVRHVGVIRLTMNSNLSEYDPTYEEFTVRALSPSSVVTFDALGQKVSLRFANGNDAQVWRVPKGESQAIRDRIGFSGATLDVALKIASVQPAPSGGTLVTNVTDYELRDNRGGVAIARVRVGEQ
jgi:hypothetical protein